MHEVGLAGMPCRCWGDEVLMAWPDVAERWAPQAAWMAILELRQTWTQDTESVLCEGY